MAGSSKSIAGVDDDVEGPTAIATLTRSNIGRGGVYTKLFYSEYRLMYWSNQVETLEIAASTLHNILCLISAQHGPIVPNL